MRTWQHEKINQDLLLRHGTVIFQFNKEGCPHSKKASVSTLNMRQEHHYLHNKEGSNYDISTYQLMET
jgi:hypothetical protein